jgi:hypothetical protein
MGVQWSGHAGDAMGEERVLARKFRARAEEVRVIARLDVQALTRTLLLKVADDYERMADLLVEIDKTKHTFDDRWISN